MTGPSPQPPAALPRATETLMTTPLDIDTKQASLAACDRATPGSVNAAVVEPLRLATSTTGDPFESRPRGPRVLWRQRFPHRCGEARGSHAEKPCSLGESGSVAATADSELLNRRRIRPGQTSDPYSEIQVAVSPGRLTGQSAACFNHAQGSNTFTTGNFGALPYTPPRT